jgi:hypothetical protein
MADRWRTHRCGKCNVESAGRIVVFTFIVLFIADILDFFERRI